MALVLYCSVCNEGIRHQGGPLPTVCPRGHQEFEWLTYTELVPRVAYIVTANDARLLKSLRINPERPLDVSREEE